MGTKQLSDNQDKTLATRTRTYFASFRASTKTKRTLLYFLDNIIAMSTTVGSAMVTDYLGEKLHKIARINKSICIHKFTVICCCVYLLQKLRRETTITPHQVHPNGKSLYILLITIISGQSIYGDQAIVC